MPSQHAVVHHPILARTRAQEPLVQMPTTAAGRYHKTFVQEYDVVLKLLLQRSAEQTLRELTDVAVRRWHNVELPEVRGTRVDLLGEGADGELVHIELQSSHDPKMALRMAEYCLRVYRVFGRFPRQILLYVGEEPLRMKASLEAPALVFSYRAVDVRELDGDRLLESDRWSDNVIAILARLRDRWEAVRRLVAKIAGLEVDEREAALSQLLILAGLRQLEEFVEREARKMPILNDILEHKVLGREFKRGLEEGVQQGVQQGIQQEAETVLRRLIERRFGAIPAWAGEKLANRSTAELEELSMRVLDALSLEELLL